MPLTLAVLVPLVVPVLISVVVLGGDSVKDTPAGRLPTASKLNPGGGEPVAVTENVPGWPTVKEGLLLVEIVGELEAHAGPDQPSMAHNPSTTVGRRFTNQRNFFDTRYAP